jgi:AcrR family transcriptional regulator
MEESEERRSQFEGARKRPTPAGRPLGRRPKVAGGGVETRAAILDAAMALFAERGFDATSVKTIAASAGVATGLIFHYFGAKEGLLEALIDERTALPLLRSTIDEIAASEPRPDAPELLRRVGVGTYGMARHAAPMLRIMVREVLQREPVRAHWEDARQRAFNALGRALSEAAAGDSEAQASIAIARTFLDAVLFEALFGPDADAETLVASIVRSVRLPGPSHPAGEAGEPKELDA